MPTKRRALVIGGSMSGLLAASRYAGTAGTSTSSSGSRASLSGRGAGIVAQPELIAHCDALGLDTRDLGVEVTTRKSLDQAGRVT